MRATLGGFPILGGAPVAWTLREGTLPVIQEFDVTPEDAKSIFGAGQRGYMVLSITPDEGPAVEVSNLWCLSIEPGPNPHVSRVRIADRRWMWSYTHVRRFYNIRRQVGVKRVTANNLVAQASQFTPKIEYWQWSLREGLPWIGQLVVKDLMDIVLEGERRYSGTKAGVIIDPSLGNTLAGLPIEDLYVNDAGDAALARAVEAYFPEGMIYIDYHGNVVVSSRASGGERDILDALNPEIQGAGHSSLVDGSILRPKEVHVLFDRKFEIRLDYEESLTSRHMTTFEGENGPNDTRTLRNVLPLPDFETEIGGQTLAQGTYATFDQAMPAWGPLPFITIGGQSRGIDHDLLQRAFIPGMDLWAAIGISGKFPSDNGAIRPWVARLNACQMNYRQTFQVDPLFMNRLTSIEATRIATIDPVFGTWAPASVYSDYAVLYTQQTLMKSASQGESPVWVTNMSAYPENNQIGPDSLVSPAVLEVISSDQGVIHIAYKANPIFGMNETTLPSQVLLDSMPTADISNRTKPISFDAVQQGVNPPRLAPSFRMSVILSGYPSTPNSTEQLHRIVVRPSDVVGMLPAAAANSAGNCNGPIMEVYVGRGTEVARVQWLDSRKSDIEKALGITPGKPDLAGLVINEDLQAAQNGSTGASLNRIAQARAATIYTALADRFKGTRTGYLNPHAVPAGWLTEVTHQIGDDGDTTTMATLPDRVPQFNMLAFLDSATRASILRLAKPL